MKKIKRSSITKLITKDGIKDGHNECAQFLEDQVKDLLLHTSPLDQAVRDILLEEIDHIFTDKDNKRMLSIPNEKEVSAVLARANLLASPGCDGIPALFYKVCWNIVKKTL